MIVSHQRRFIFFAVPRTATHAARQVLRQALGPGDWEQQALFGAQTSPVPGIAKLKHGHVSFRQARACLPEEVWSAYFKFGFVRHPLDRFISACCFLNRRNPDFRGKEAAFMRAACDNEGFMGRMLLRPQWELLTDAGGEVAMDYVGRYETLQESFDEICRRIEMPPAVLPKKNESVRANLPPCDQGIKEAVARRYRKDFELFGYDPQDDPRAGIPAPEATAEPAAAG